MGLNSKKPFLGVLDKARLKLEILLVSNLDMILSEKIITKALIRHICAGWSVPLLFANDRFSRIEAHYNIMFIRHSLCCI